MRVLHFFKTYLPDSVGGIEQVINQLCRTGQHHGIEHQVLTLSSNPEPAELMVDGHRVYRARLDLQLASTGFSYSVVPQFRRLAAEADIINFHFPWPFMDVVHLLAGLDKPAVVTYHSDIVRQRHLLKLYRPLMHRFLDSVDRIVVASPNYLGSSETLRRYQHKAEVIPYGLDKQAYPVPSEECAARWRREVGEQFFLFVGVMRYYKGLHILLEAAKGTNYPVVIAGAGPLERQLKIQARALGLEGHVRFVGRVSDEDKVALLQLSRAFVFPSHLRSEAFGISLLEGAMYGKPMISCEIGTGTTYINTHGKTGLVVPPNDPGAFRDAMRWIWENSVAASEMGRQAEARFWELFSAESMGCRWHSLYRDLLAEQDFKKQKGRSI